jgi:hypothetical protein
MGIHPKFNPTSEGDAVVKIRNALAHMFPLAAVRIVSDDEIAIEDVDGDDWQIVVKEPG